MRLCKRKFFASIFIAVIPLLFFEKTNAQEISAALKPDSTHILIGDFLSARLIVKFPDDSKVMIAPVADTVGRMELVKQSKIDTSKSDGNTVFTQIFTVSAYDSGNFRLGPLKLFFTDKNGKVDTLFTDAPLISVNTIPVDTTKAIKPIKAPLSVPYSWQEFIPYIIGGIALIAAIIVAIYFLKRRKKKPKISKERPRPKDPPHVWAKKELKKLEEEKLWQKDEVKQYYSRLTDILRLYLEYRFNWFALESTTEQIRDEITEYDIPEEGKEKLLGILQSADLVKFAKMLPLPDENDLAMKNAFAFVEITEQKEVLKAEVINK